MTGSLVITRFDDVTGTSARRASTTWPRFAAWLEKVPPQPEKHRAPLIKLASFGDRRTERESLRHDGNVMQVFGIEADCDGGELNPYDAVGRLERHHLRATVTTTWSHTADHPRLRVFAPCSAPVEPSVRRQLVARLNGALGGHLNPESFALSLSYFIGGKPGGEYLVLSTFDDPEEGFCVDLVDELDPVAIYPPLGSPAEARRGPAPPLCETISRGERNRVLTSFAGTLRRRGLDVDEIVACLEIVNAKRCNPPLPERDLCRIAASIARKPADKPLAAVGGRP